MNKNTKNIVLGLGAVGLLALYINRPKEAEAQKGLKERGLFEVAEAIEVPNQVERSSIEDKGAIAALSSKTVSVGDEKGESATSLWDSADKAPEPEKQPSNEKPSDVLSQAKLLIGGDPKANHGDPHEAISAPKIEPQRIAPSVKPRHAKTAPPEGVILASFGAPATVNENHAQPGVVRRRSAMADLMAMSAGTTTRVSGRDTMADGNLLQEGSSYLGVIEDPIRAVEGEPQPVTITTIGKLSSNTIAVPFKMTGIATLNKDRTRVRVEVKRCVDSRPSARSVDCSGVIGDIEGWDGIGGRINSPGIWGTLVRTASVLGSQMALSKMTSSVTQNGVLMDQTQSNAVLESLSEAVRVLGDDVAKKIEAGGTNIVVTGQSIVRVKITKDSPLW